MKLFVPATILCFLIAAPTYAHQQEQQQEQQDKDKQQEKDKQKQDEKQKQGAEKQQQDKVKQDDKAKQEDRAKQDKQQTDQQKQERKYDQKQQEQSQRQTDERQQPDRSRAATEQRGGSRTISQTEFHEHFGREHHFHVGHVDNQRFVYGGYTFGYGEAWPVGWGYDDDFYIDYIDGQYYLIDLTHPGPRLILVIE